MSSNGRKPLGLIVLFCLAACRDAPTPPVLPERPAPAATYPLQLTFSIRDDRTPSWSADGDSVYYVRRDGTLFGLPTTNVYVLPANLGIADEILINLGTAPETPRLVYSPTPAPGGKIALAQVESFYPAEVSEGGPRCTGDSRAMETPNRSPRLARLRVHAVTPAQVRFTDVSLAGVRFDRSVPESGLDGKFLVHFLPFQRIWEDENAVPFGLTWSPDGNELAFTNGVGIFRWAVSGESQPEQVSGTDDGVSPAWSPSGSQIAFTRFERSDSAFARCEHFTLFGLAAIQHRWEYFTTARRLIVLALASGETIDLGEGSEPAWVPDGQVIIARRGNLLWSIPVNGSAARPLPETEGGREPAVSPDGRLLVFAKMSERGDHNIWIIEL